MFAELGIRDCFLPGFEYHKNMVWIGGRRQDPNRCGTTPFVWKFKDGSEIPFTFNKWEDNQPDCYQNNEHCAHIKQVPDYRWNDYPCTTSICSVCEI